MNTKLCLILILHEIIFGTHRNVFDQALMMEPNSKLKYLLWNFISNVAICFQLPRLNIKFLLIQQWKTLYGIWSLIYKNSYKINLKLKSRKNFVEKFGNKWKVENCSFQNNIVRSYYRWLCVHNLVIHCVVYSHCGFYYILMDEFKLLNKKNFWN